MNKLLVMLVMFASVLVSGCGTMFIRQISEEEAFKYDNKYLSEHEAWIKTNQDTMVQIEKWIQPVNKKEECKIFVGTSNQDDRTLHPDYRVYWDGQCKNGYAYGLGREFEKGFLSDLEAIALYSGNKEKPIYYYTKNKLKNVKYEGIDDDNKDKDGQYVVITEIKDDPINFEINIRYGNMQRQIPFVFINASPLQDNVMYIKEYGNFAYLIIDLRKNANDNRNYHFSYLIKGKANGYSFEITKDGQRFAGELVDGNIVKRNIELPQSFYDNADKIFNEIIDEGQKALNAQSIALQVKQQYKQKICTDKVNVNFLDNAEYKAICEEDKYMADIKIKLDKELERISAQRAQDRMVRAREAEAMAAQRQAAAAQQQANTAAWASFNQSMHNMNMTNQMQQLNNNLFMMNRNPQQINVDHTIRTSNSPMWTPVR